MYVWKYVCTLYIRTCQLVKPFIHFYMLQIAYENNCHVQISLSYKHTTYCGSEELLFENHFCNCHKRNEQKTLQWASQPVRHLYRLTGLAMKLLLTIVFYFFQHFFAAFGKTIVFMYDLVLN